MTEETVALRRQLVEALAREIKIARDRATAARQEATSAEDRLTVLLRAMAQAGIIPADGKTNNERSPP